LSVLASRRADGAGATISRVARQVGRSLSC
jgi:hypothetical protein